MNNSIILKKLRGEETSRPPFWYMRQAGRVLPSYLELKKKHSFWEMMQDAELGAKVTLLPVSDLSVDAAILFSDILVVPYSMGMGLEFTNQGPVFEKPLCTLDNPLDALHPDVSKLDYVYRVIDRIKKDIPSGIPLIGFSGAPLTVLCYMLQGLGRKAEFPDAIQFIYKNIAETKQLVDAVTEATIEYIKGQIDHGIEIFQLFDTHAGILPYDFYNQIFMPSIKKISSYIRSRNIPFIFFPKGFGSAYQEINPDICDFVSIDWQTPLNIARQQVHKDVGLQGNLDPRILFSDKKTIENKLISYIDFYKKHPKWIFNLGHGFIPGIPYENARFLSDWILAANW
jgi:uroporphyrinogen decarboxylase